MSTPLPINEPEALRHRLRRNAQERLVKWRDTWPDSTPVNGALDALLLVAVPLLTFGFVCLVTGVAGVIYRHGCNSTSNFIDSLLFQTGKPSTCQSVPFLSDIPMVILSFTCPLAMVTFHLIRWRLARLHPALTQSRLVGGDYAGREDPRIQKLEGIVDLNARIRFSLFVVTTAMTTWLYTRALNHGHLFTILARNGVSTVPELRDRWWANYHHHPALAVLCILVGSVGVYYALRLAVVYFGVGVSFYKLPSSTNFQYVPRWQDKSYGWSAITGTLFLAYISVVSLAVSLVAVFDMLQNVEWTFIVAICFAVLGIAANLAIFAGSLFLMLRAHSAVGKRLQDRLKGRLPGPGNPGTGPVPDSDPDLGDDFQKLMAATDLASWRKIPVASLSGTAFKVVPGAYALIQLAARAWFIKH